MRGVVVPQGLGQGALHHTQPASTGPSCPRCSSDMPRGRPRPEPPGHLSFPAPWSNTKDPTGQPPGRQGTKSTWPALPTSPHLMKCREVRSTWPPTPCHPTPPHGHLSPPTPHLMKCRDVASSRPSSAVSCSLNREATVAGPVRSCRAARCCPSSRTRCAELPWSTFTTSAGRKPKGSGGEVRQGWGPSLARNHFRHSGHSQPCGVACPVTQLASSPHTPPPPSPVLRGSLFLSRKPAAE